MKLFITLLMTTFFFNSIAQKNAFISGSNGDFEENKGQILDENGLPSNEVKYHLQEDGLGIFMLSNGIAYQFSNKHYPKGYQDAALLSEDPMEWKSKEGVLSDQIWTETYRMDMELVGSNPKTVIIATEKEKAFSNYYNRNVLTVHSYQKLIYKDIYKGIDWVIYNTKKGIKYDFVVHPGADPNQIQIRFKHHENLQLNPDGGFSLSNRMGAIYERSPVSFQNKQELATKFVLEGQDKIRFELASYDKSQVLIIDPNVVWETYYGGAQNQRGRGCAIDHADNVYLVGFSNMDLNLAAGGYQMVPGGNIDTYLVKFDSTGSRIWATYYGGADNDYGLGATVDIDDNIYIALTTYSTTLAFNGHDNTQSGNADAFLVKFDSAGLLKWATYYGGGNYDEGNSCTTDKHGNVYLAGHSGSVTPLLYNGHQNASNGGRESFVVKFDSAGVRQWGTLYGSNGNDYGFACAVDSQCNVFLAGLTYSSNGANKIAIGGHQNNYAGQRDAFLVKFDSTGVRQWGTFYGGNDRDYCNGCTVDAAGNVYIMGSTVSSNNIAYLGGQNTKGNNTDAYIAKFNGAGVRQWGTYFGSTFYEEFMDCTVDEDENVFVTGAISTKTFPFFGAKDGGSLRDAVLIKLDNLSNFQWGFYLGGPGEDIGRGCVRDAHGNIYIGGETNSASNMTLSNNGFQNTFGGTADGFLARYEDLPTGIDSHVACDSFTWTNGVTYTSSNNTASIRIPNGATNGLDSISILDLTISYTATTTDVVMACDSFTWINGVTYTSSNNTAMVIVPNSSPAGCDSIINLNLMMGYSATGTDVIVTCDNHTWINGVTYTSSNNTATFTMVNGSYTGCDSTVSLDLTINYSSIDTVIISACNSYTWMDGVTYTVSNNSANVVFPSAAANGCDSIIRLNLTINTTSSGTDVVSACNNYTWIDGNTYTSNNNSTFFVLPNASVHGCDSMVFLDLTLNYTTINIDTVVACDSYTWIDGNTYTSDNNIATVIIPNAAVNGCDSLILLDLDIIGINKNLTQNSNTLISNEAGASYQWINCLTNSWIVGATAQSFSPVVNGDYAVIITKNNCIDTSVCVNINFNGLEAMFSEQLDLQIYPNPTEALVTVVFPHLVESTIELLNIHGQLLLEEDLFHQKEIVLDLSELPTGVYLLKARIGNKIATTKLIKL